MEIDVTQKYRLFSGEKVQSIRCFGSGAWDNRGGSKSSYQIVLENGKTLCEWYYNKLGVRTGEKGLDWDHPDNLITEEKYQASIVKIVCGCEAPREIALVNSGANSMLSYLLTVGCGKCGCMFIPESAEPAIPMDKSEDKNNNAWRKELESLNQIVQDKSIAPNKRLKRLGNELTKMLDSLEEGFVLEAKDVRMDIFTSGVNCPIIMKLTHIPTGCVVQKEGTSRHLLRKELCQELTQKVKNVCIVDCRETKSDASMEQCSARMDRAQKIKGEKNE